MDLLLILGSAAVVAAFGVLWWAVSGSITNSVELTASRASRDQRDILLAQSGSSRTIKPLFEGLGRRAASITPAGRVEAVRRKLEQAGMDEKWTVERYYAYKVLAAVVAGGAVLLWFLTSPGLGRLLIAGGAGALGWFIPNIVVLNNRQKRREAVERDVADTIDQLAVMVRAGLGLDGAMARLSRSNDGPLAREFARVQQDLRFGVNRDTALENMTKRVDLPDLYSVIAAIGQSERLGVPIAKTLDIQAGELRERRRQRAEEQAMKLPVKILFPMVICILPVILIVILGPALINILDSLDNV